MKASNRIFCERAPREVRVNVRSRRGIVAAAAAAAIAFTGHVIASPVRSGKASSPVRRALAESPGVFGAPPAVMLEGRTSGRSLLPPRMARLLEKASGRTGFAVAPAVQLPPLTTAAAQLAAVTFARGYGGANADSGYLAKVTADGGFILVGETDSFGNGGVDFWMFKISSAGAIVWQKTFGTAGNDFGGLSETPDGGFLAEFWSNGSPYTLVKMTEAGVIQWQKTYGTTDDSFGAAYPITGGYLVTGSRIDFQTFSTVETLVRLDSNGNIVWQRQYTTESGRFGFIQELADGSLVASGTRISFDDNDSVLYLVKMNSSGVIQWQKTYGGAGAEFGLGVTPTADGGFLATALTNSWGVNAGSEEYSDFLLIKLDSAGNPQWTSVYGGDKDDFGFVVATDDGYTVSGSTDSFGAGGDDFFLARLNTTGGFLWGKTYGGPDDDGGFVGPDSSGGGYLAQATTDAFGAGNDDLWLLKLDTNGNITWQRTYGGASDDFGSAIRLSGGDILITGDTESWGAGLTDAWAVRLGTTGALAAPPLGSVSALAACTLVQDTSIQPQAFTFTVSPATPAVATDDYVASTPAYTSGTGAIVAGTSTATVTDLCSAQQKLVAIAAATPTSGPPPLAVAFTGTAAGGTPPYTFEWDFGDGTPKSNQQSPAHTYANVGIYNAVLKVTDSTPATATDNELYIDVNLGCTLYCFSNVPQAGTAGQSIDFFGGAEWVSCNGSPTYAWTFGDGQTSTQQGPSHAYAANGTYTWTLTVSQDGASCTQTGTITVTGGATTTTTYWIPSIAHAPGAGTSKWRSNIGVVNRSGATANLTLLFVPYAAGSTVTRTHTLANGATFEWADVLVSLFGFADSANTKGTVKITSDREIVAMARTYNQAASGTFGQYYPALTAAQGITSSQPAVLPLLKKNTAFRANVGFQNLGPDSCSGEVKLFNAAGAQVGSTRTLTASGDKYIQEDDVFTKAGAGTQDVAYARVQPTTAGCKAWFFGSVVDAVTNDPTTIPQQLSQAGPFWIPSIAHAPGAGTSKWRSNIAVVNRSGATANLTLVFVPYAAGSTVTRNHSLANNATVEWADVLVSLFGFADSANTKGTVKITSDRSIYAMARTYNQATSGTFGQYYPALVAADARTNGQTAVLPLLKKSADFRSNTGFQNLGTAQCTGTVKLYNAAGAQVGSTRTLTAATDKYIQEDDVFSKAGAGNQQPAYAVVEITTAGGKAWWFGSVIDAVTNDPTTIPQQ
jgi:PKD repeat protein